LFADQRAVEHVEIGLELPRLRKARPRRPAAVCLDSSFSAVAVSRA
jgi:hypothetical protein